MEDNYHAIGASVYHTQQAEPKSSSYTSSGIVVEQETIGFDSTRARSGVSGNFRCRDTTSESSSSWYQYEKRSILVTKEQKMKSGFSLLPTWNSRFAQRLERLRITDSTIIQDEKSKNSNKNDDKNDHRNKHAVQQDYNDDADDDNDADYSPVTSTLQIIHPQVPQQQQEETTSDEGSLLTGEKVEHGRITIVPQIPAIVIMEHIAPYINDRLVWNSLASLNRETYAISLSLNHIYRPWPCVRWRVTTIMATPALSVSSVSSQRKQQRQKPRRRFAARGAVQTSARPWTVSFGHDYLCCGTDRGNVMVRMINNGSTKSVRGHSGRVNSIQSCGDWLISGGDDRATRIWNVATMSCEAILIGHMGSITSIAVLPYQNRKCGICESDDDVDDDDETPTSSHLGGRMLVATAGLDSDIHLYTVCYEGNKVVSTEHLVNFAEEFNPKPIYSIVMYEKGGQLSLVSGGLNGKVRLWDVDDAIAMATTSTANARGGDHAGTDASEREETTDVPKIHRNTCIYKDDGEIKSIAISRDKEQIAAACGRNICHGPLSVKTLREYDFVHQHHQLQRQRQRQHQRLRQQESLFPNRADNIIFDSENDFNDEREDEDWRLLKGHYAGDIRCIAFSSDGKSIASACSDGSIRLWDLREGHWKRKWKAHNGFMVCSIAVTPDGLSLLSAGSDGTIAIKGLVS